MSTGILKALMHLFAIIGAETSKIGSIDQSREIVAMFLRQQLNKALVNEYLTVYDAFIETYNKKDRGNRKTSAKRASLSSVKILRICTQINEELHQKEKYFVILRLLEFITSFENSTEQEWDFVNVVYDTFNIETEVYENIKSLVQQTENDSVENEEFLYVTSEKDTQYSESKFIYKDSLEGKMAFVRIENENMFLFRYFGNQDLSLNGQSMIKDRSYLFMQGATVRGGLIQPIYYSDIIHKFLSDSDQQTIVLRAENTSYYFNKKEQALHQFNLVEESGNLIGIMGGSGSGKSTMLNVLNGNYKPTYGKVTLNGIDIHKEQNKIEGVIGHITQDDLLIEELTVYQNLFYNAKLSFGNKKDEEIDKLVLDTLHSIGLAECKDLIVGSPLMKTISGGQRKRVNIALELIREPSVLFVDEPTSGLSSRDSENIMDLLKELTLKGKLVFVVIHQPSSDIFKMFDKLFILDQGGYPIYYGNPIESIIHFKRLVNHANIDESECGRCGNVNPEQIFNIIEAKIVDEYGNMTEHRKITPIEWNNFFNVIIGNHIAERDQKREVPRSSFSIPSKLKQFTVFFVRDILSKLTNKQYMIINALEAPLLAFVLAFFIKYFYIERGKVLEYSYYENVNISQYLFISVIVSLFLGLSVSAEEIIKDRGLLKREKFLNLSNRSYLLSKISVMLIISAIQSLLFVFVGNVILEIKGMWFSYWLLLFSTSSFANLLGLNISASFNSAKVIYIMIPILIIPQLLFSGVIVKFDKLNPWFSSQSSVPWVGNIMASRWAFEALTVNQFKDNKFMKEYYKLEKLKSDYSWKKNYWADKMQEKVRICEKIIETGEGYEELGYNLGLIKNELEKESKTNPEFSFASMDRIQTDKIDQVVIKDLYTFIDHLKRSYRNKWNDTNSELDDMIPRDSLAKTEHLSLQERYHNINLEDYVTNSKSLDKIIEYKSELVQKADPIYETPHHKSFFNAHFLAPTKNLFGYQIDTYWANLAVIWLMTIGLSILLFFNGLKWILDQINLVGKLLNIRIKLRILKSE